MPKQSGNIVFAGFRSFVLPNARPHDRSADFVVDGQDPPTLINKSERSLSAGIQPLYDRLRFIAPVTYGLRLLSLSVQAC